MVKTWWDTLGRWKLVDQQPDIWKHCHGHLRSHYRHHSEKLNVADSPILHGNCADAGENVVHDGSNVET